MATYNDNKHRIILDKPEDWDGWLSYIKGAINDTKVWNLVNPDLPTHADTMELHDAYVSMGQDSIPEVEIASNQSASITIDVNFIRGSAVQNRRPPIVERLRRDTS